MSPLSLMSPIFPVSPYVLYVPRVPYVPLYPLCLPCPPMSPFPLSPLLSPYNLHSSYVPCFPISLIFLCIFLYSASISFKSDC